MFFAIGIATVWMPEGVRLFVEYPHPTPTELISTKSRAMQKLLNSPERAGTEWGFGVFLGTRDDALNRKGTML